ncbi:MAG TPA: preprotein translocase subunit SecE [Sulfurihydrogenibium sp.]|jgi:preprotein translocase subunit SecE|uniref:preprotein translocase subunit SecE n=1 Tax=unclassified Sulfurihydrogenibium TaxID=2619248 RepID=UPI0001750CAE|nr:MULTISPECIES: preprotein translocase subunit SecE [unclassified Sulfurihydrogenibium]ACD65949.1 preprotein translocase, SecE subunit [Sulfurihydrogenibium sp. YO3AOP1]HBT98168.1 preprotein translocase subunit SecE [Sulfurihydrogenibium sp.]
MVKYLNFLKEVFEELKKVTWPSKNLVKTATIAVIVLTLIMALYLWSLDILFTKIIAFIMER